MLVRVSRMFGTGDLIGPAVYVYASNFIMYWRILRKQIKIRQSTTFSNFQQFLVFTLCYF